VRRRRKRERGIEIEETACARLETGVLGLTAVLLVKSSVVGACMKHEDGQCKAS